MSAKSQKGPWGRRLVRVNAAAGALLRGLGQMFDLFAACYMIAIGAGRVEGDSADVI
jgi:hypothetical protein